MSDFNLTYPTKGNQQESKIISSGELIFLVGANGTGKSTLMHKFSTLNPRRTRHITAHRQVWFRSNALDLTPASREQHEQQVLSQDLQPTARYRDDLAVQRSQITIFDLIDAENVDARKIADALRQGDRQTAEELAQVQAPLARMNDILRISNLNIQIQIEQGSKLLATREGVAPYSIAELSDGERNAIIIISSVLTAPPNTLILLDEPERHLHRSIVSPLINTLLNYRNDCAFVVSTHDISLPLDQQNSSALLVRKYNHTPQFWDIDYINSVDSLDTEIGEAVLGARRNILFIEGKSTSLDLQIYQILYPNISIKPLGSCVDVERIVRGINQSDENHWVKAVGIIDRDNRDESECRDLENFGVIAIDQYSVESIYYHPILIKAMLERVALINDIDPNNTYEELVSSFTKSFEPHINRMAARLVERRVRDELLKKAPNWKLILQEPTSFEFSTQSLFEEEKSLLQGLIENQDIEKMISRYPIRETPALESISKALCFPTQAMYEQAIRKMLIDEKGVREQLKSLVDKITTAIAN